MATIPREFFDFLKMVDGEVERPETFLRQCAGAFMANSATDQFDLIGFDMVDCKRGVSICGCIAWLLMSFSFCQVQCLMPESGHLCVERSPKQMRGVLLQYFLVWASAQTYLCRLAQGLADRLPAGSDGSNRGESVGALLQAVRHEEAKVHLDLPALLKVCLRVAPLGSLMHSSLCIGDQFGYYESQMLPAHRAHRQACRPSCKS